MKIVTCIKQVKDLDMVLAKDWIVNEESKDVDIEYVNTIINTYDENALEMALRISDDNDIQTIALTVGDESCDRILKKALQVKVSGAIRVNYNNKLTYNPIGAAKLIKNSVEKIEDVKIVMCGRQSSEGDIGQTGLILSEMLGWPCVTLVSDIEFKDGEFYVTHQVDEGVETLNIEPPFVLTVTQSADKFLRMATIRDILQAKKKQIKVWDTKDLNINEDIEKLREFELEQIYIEKQVNKCSYIEGSTVEEKVHKLYEQLIRRDVIKEKE